MQYSATKNLIFDVSATRRSWKSLCVFALLSVCVGLWGCGADTDDEEAVSQSSPVDTNAPQTRAVPTASENPPAEAGDSERDRDIQEADSTDTQVDLGADQPNLDLQASDTDTQYEPQPVEPTAQEIARTIELETELEQIVASAVEILDPEQAQILLQKIDQWNQYGYGCAEGPEKVACEQYHIRSRIREIDNRMRGFSTEF